AVRGAGRARLGARLGRGARRGRDRRRGRRPRGGDQGRPGRGRAPRRRLPVLTPAGSAGRAGPALNGRTRTRAGVATGGRGRAGWRSARARGAVTDPRHDGAATCRAGGGAAGVVRPRDRGREVVDEPSAVLGPVVVALVVALEVVRRLGAEARVRHDIRVAVTGELTLERTVVRLGAVVLQRASDLGLLCLLTAAAHGSDPLNVEAGRLGAQPGGPGV